MVERIGLFPQSPANLSPVSDAKPEVGADRLVKSFGGLLSQAIEKLEHQHAEVNALNRQFAVGELPDVHKLMIASEKAALGLELTVQIRNKAIEAYQEITRMQV